MFILVLQLFVRSVSLLNSPVPYNPVFCTFGKMSSHALSCSTNSKWRCWETTAERNKSGQRRGKTMRVSLTTKIQNSVTEKSYWCENITNGTACAQETYDHRQMEIKQYKRVLKNGDTKKLQVKEWERRHSQSVFNNSFFDDRTTVVSFTCVPVWQTYFKSSISTWGMVHTNISPSWNCIYY